MEGRVTVNDNSIQFIKRSEEACDRALKKASEDIKILAQVYVPKKSGNLSDRIETRRINSLHYQVRVDEDYAAFQERGMRVDGSHVVRRYTSAGTGKGYLSKAGGRIAARIVTYFRQSTSRTV